MFCRNLQLLFVLSLVAIPYEAQAAKRPSKKLSTKKLMVRTTKAKPEFCGQADIRIDSKIRRGFDALWSDVDSTVGVEFFLLVLKSNDRMPASEESSASYYRGLLYGMKRTSKDLASHGVKFKDQDIKKIESLISRLEVSSSCSGIATRR